MFSKKRCSNCDRRVSRRFDFCPYCGEQINDSQKDSEKDYGLLGKSDNLEEARQQNNSLGPSAGLFGGLVNGLMKQLEKEMGNLSKMSKEPLDLSKNQGLPKTNFQLFVNGKRVNLPQNLAGIQIAGMPGMPRESAENSKKRKIVKQQSISEELLKNSSKLPRKEAKTKFTRTADKIVYELDTPGLNNINNILINQLENAIEIKAYTDKTVYIKTLKVKLPLARYTLSPEQGKLFLEFKTE